MTIDILINQCEIRLEYLKSQKHSNIQLSNLDLVNKIDIEIIQVEQTIEKLKNK
jgi:hypothetical protein